MALQGVGVSVALPLPTPFPSEIYVRYIVYLASVVLCVQLLVWKWFLCWVLLLIVAEFFLCDRVESARYRPTKGIIIESSSGYDGDCNGNSNSMTDSLSSLGSIYGGATDVKSVRITGKQFAMYRIIISLADPPVKWEVWRRYSEFSDVKSFVMHGKHLKRLPSKLVRDIEALPKKTLWRRLDERHLTKRKRRLQIFANALLQDRALSNCQEIREFFGVMPDFRASIIRPPRKLRSNFSSPQGSQLPDFTILGPGSNSIRSMWYEEDANLFKVRGENYLEDRVKEFAGKSIGQLVHVDLYKVEGNSVQDHVLKATIDLLPPYVGIPLEQRPFLFVVNFQVPGNPAFSCVFYFAIPNDIQPGTEKFRSQLDKFVRGDDNYRNERFKLIPSIVDGPTIVKTGVGSMTDGNHSGATPGKKLQMKYFITPHYVECDINIASNSVANYLTRLSRRYSKSIVVDIAFTIEGIANDELPERIIGVCRLDHLDMDIADDFPSVKPKQE